ncbi:hypothetical protein Taro_015057, partial [Colocasia esculenta]|nr:hypothetical protein [Colocasia esculenta]
HQTSLQRLALIPTSFLLKGWSVASGDEARSGKAPFAAKILFWKCRSVSTHRQTVSTPLASTVLIASLDSHLVSTHRWTVSTPLVAPLRTCFWDSQPVSTHRWTV